MLTIRVEDVGGSEMHGMTTFQSDTSTIENPVLPVPHVTMAGQDVDDGAHPIDSQAGGVPSIPPCFCIPEKAIPSFTSSRRARGK